MAGFGRANIGTGYDDRNCFSSCFDLCVLDYRLGKEPQRFEVDMTAMPNSPDQTAAVEFHARNQQLLTPRASSFV